MEHCKHCEAELEEGSTLCPSCGKDNASEELPAQEEGEVTEALVQEEISQKNQEAAVKELQETAEAAPEAAEAETPVEKSSGFRLTPLKAALAVAALVILVAVLVGLVVSGMDKSALPQPTETLPTLATEETVAATTPADGNPDDETCKGTYTAADEEVIANKDVVVATAGEHQLTLAQLQIYYWQEVNSFLSSYGSYASYYGLDYTQPLDTQPCMFLEGRTWQQYFLARALTSWNTYLALDVAAEQAGYEMEQEYKDFLTTMADTMEQEAVANGFANAQEFMEANLGAGPTIQDYVDFMAIYYHGYSYFNNYYSQLTATDEEIEAMFTEHEAEYAENGLTKETKSVDVRHILIYPEGATSETVRAETFPEEAWTAGEANAQSILDQWLAGDATEESFAALAEEHSGDPGSAANGGLYTGVNQGDMVEAFDVWCFDPARQVGDYGIVRTEFGFHIMYYSGETFLWKESVSADVINEKINTMTDAAVEALPITVDYSKILLSYVSLG